MNKQEVTALLAILSAYYGNPKAEAADMVNAWHVVLKDYEYAIAEQACIEFAKNDNREYSQFPSIGNIVAAIKDEYNCFLRIRNFAFHNKEYDEIGDRAKKWITAERYERLKKCEDRYLLENMETIRRTLVKDNAIPEKI